VTACARCRSRKQRCDQNIPACSNCERAGVECVGVDIDGSVAPRRQVSYSGSHACSDTTYSYIKSLEDRIAYLEDQLEVRVPEDDRVAGPIAGDIGSLSLPPQSVEGGNIYEIVNEAALHCFQTASSQNTIDAEGQLLLHSFPESIGRASPSARPLDGHRSLLSELPYKAQAAFPGREATSRLVNTYFEHADFFSPTITSKEDFLEAIYTLIDKDQSTNNDIELLSFRAFIVFATAVLLLNRVDSSFPVARAEVYYTAAMGNLARNTKIICTGDVPHLCNLLLLIQYSCFASNLSAAWHFLGLATRLAIELGLHQDLQAPDETEWLFWSLYTFERNLNVILGRPFSIPDEAIRTPLPTASDSDTRRVHAIHLIMYRRLESEMYTTLNQLPPRNGAVLDICFWRESMRQRLLEWRASTPATQRASSPLAPLDIFDGHLYNGLVLLYYPSRSFPHLSLTDLSILANSASESIGCYKRAFRDGHLRFYWRTIHNLFRSGVAMAYCVRAHVLHQFGNINQANMISAINTCSSILWAMAERYPPGKIYRDVFEHLANAVVQPNEGDVGGAQWPHEGTSLFSINFPNPQDAELPSTMSDTLRWTFGDTHQH